MNLTALTEEQTTLIQQKWLSEIDSEEHEVFSAEYQQLFNMILASSAYGELGQRYNTPIFFGVIGKSNECYALIELVQSRKGASVWVKMMDVYLCPLLELADDTEETTIKRLDAFKEALLGIFALTKTVSGADTVKVYGRTDAILSFLRGMHSAFSVFNSLGTIKGIQVSIEGRWLVFRSGR